MNKTRELQGLLRLYKEQTGKKEVDMRELAEWAVRTMGYKLPAPTDPFDRLARQLSKAARDEIRHDAKTGRPYRANHAVPKISEKGQLLFTWVDIDEAEREPMKKSLVQRREQMIGDALQLSFDQDHWNGIHPNEEPIDLPMDFTDDVLWRKAAYDDDSEDKAAE